MFKYIKELKRLLKEGNYDIVHSNMNALSVFPLYAAKKAGIKIRIAHSHSTSNKKEWKKNIVKKLLRPFSKTYATHYFACSELAGRWLFGDKTFNAGKVTIINNAVDLDRFKYNAELRREVRKELNLENELVIGHIGRFMPQKNHTFLIDVFSEFNKIVPQSKLLLLGDGPLFNEIVDKVETQGLKDKVVFAGVQEQPEKYYQAMDCFLLPSLYEGLPVVGVEAQMNGLPCFFSDGITAEAKILDSTIYLPLESNAKTWAKEIEQTLTIVDSGKALEISEERQNAYIHFEGSLYDIKAESRKLFDLYEGMLEKR